MAAAAVVERIVEDTGKTGPDLTPFPARALAPALPMEARQPKPWGDCEARSPYAQWLRFSLAKAERRTSVRARLDAAIAARQFEHRHATPLLDWHTATMLPMRSEADRPARGPQMLTAVEDEGSAPRYVEARVIGRHRRPSRVAIVDGNTQSALAKAGSL